MEQLKIITANIAKGTVEMQEEAIKGMEKDINEYLSQGYKFEFASRTGYLLCAFLVKDELIE